MPIMTTLGAASMRNTGFFQKIFSGGGGTGGGGGGTGGASGNGYYDDQFNTATLLIHGNGGTIISDASTNAFDMTVAGTPRATNFTPFGTGWSYYLSSGNNFANTISGTGMSPYTNSTWTMEFWIYPTGAFSSYHYVVSKGTSFNRDWGVGLTSVTASTATIFYYWSPSTGDYSTSTGSATITVNNWYHIAVVSTSGAVVTYVNGTSVGTGTQTQFNTSNPLNLFFGSFMDYGNTFYPFVGYLSNFRYVQGTAVYTGAFTPPTSVLSTTQSSGTNIAAISGASSTKLLTAQSNRFIDNSPSGFTITPTGLPSVQSFNPFNLTNTGSDGAMYFNGSSDHLTTATATPLVLSGSVYTIECWCYLTSNDFSSYRILVMKRVVSTAASYNIFFNITTGYLGFYNGTEYVSTVAPKINAWNHVAGVYDGTNINLFMNGTRVLQSATTNPDNGGSLWIGVEADASTNRFIGYISNIRILKGTALYSGTTYTIPTVPLTAITNTSLLTLQNKYSHNTTQGHQDSSTNQLLITSTGSPAAGTFSPFSQTGWSNYFNGTTDYLQLPTTFIGAMGSGTSSNYTVECWVYLNVLPTGATYSTVLPILTAGTIWEMWSIANNGYFFGDRAGSYVSATGTIPTVATWSHLAFVNSGTSMTVYLNGTSVATCSLTGTWVTSQPGLIGHNGYAYFNGYISNLHVTTTVRYTGTFTPSTVPLTPVTGTILLTCQSNRFIDNSVSPYALTAYGTPSVQAFSPFVPVSTAAYSNSSVGGSTYFNGSADYLSVNATTYPTVKLGSGDFTLECWVYITTHRNYNTIYDSRSSGGSAGGLVLACNSSGQLYVYNNGYVLDSTSGSAATAIAANSWHHIALVRSGTASGNLRLYVDGARVAVSSAASSTNLSDAVCAIGYGSADAAYYFPGYISSFRIMVGTAQYTGTTYTIPTSPLTSITNTQLLLNGTNTAILDQTAKNNIITTGKAKVSTAQYKFGTGSVHFVTSGDGLTIPATKSTGNFGKGNFTVELWMKYTTAGNQTADLIRNTQWGLVDYNDGLLYWQTVYGATNLGAWSHGLLANGNWHHVAVVRSATSTFTIYVDGTSIGTTSDTTNYSTNSDITIGSVGVQGQFLGYMDDIRISKYARYTGNFTPPAFEFGDTGSVGGPPAAVNGGTITTVGSYTVHTFTSAGVFTVPSSLAVDYLIVAGGGGGGSFFGSGGGGAGGLLTANSYSLPSGTYTISIGGGGTGGGPYVGDTNNPQNGNGGNSSVIGGSISLYANGGGGGGNYVNNSNKNGLNGGSGGGGGGTDVYGQGTGGTGIAGQGNSGGNALGASTVSGGGGGGGAGAAGASASSTLIAGNGGIGLNWQGLGTYYAGGGGGGTASTSGTPGSGGAGGGGRGGIGYSAQTQTPQAGNVNTGGGGGGQTLTTQGPAGGSGIVIIRYLTPSDTITGGLRYGSGAYIVHQFTSSGTFITNTTLTIDYLVVAGGGGGCDTNGGGGGGGAGGMLTASSYSLPAGSYTVFVGDGGTGAVGLGTNGSNSYISGSGITTITAVGGGRGGDSSGVTGGNGGSGGGGSYGSAGGTGVAGQGNDGGTGALWTGAGGGGKGSAGSNSGSQSFGGAGGTAAASSISGSSVYYAGGGGGGTYSGSSGPGGLGGGTATTAQKGGGGNGGYSARGVNGNVNTGGGGGGGSNYNGGGNGGSGVVFIRYLA